MYDESDDSSSHPGIVTPNFGILNLKDIGFALYLHEKRTIVYMSDKHFCSPLTILHQTPGATNVAHLFSW
tara:strand:- start:548 stop:757 length:210 start_codon:yes stop_codon:yes gene_type:complete